MSSVPQFPRRDGMRVDNRNVLGRTAHFLKESDHDETGDSYVPEEFCRHLGGLGNRYYQGDKEVLDEFLQLYNCDEARNRETPNRAKPVSRPGVDCAGNRESHEVVCRQDGTVRHGIAQPGFGNSTQSPQVQWNDGKSDAVNPTNETEFIVLASTAEIPTQIAAWLEKHQLRLARWSTCGEDAYRMVSAGEFDPVDVLLEARDCSSLTLFRKDGDSVAVGGKPSVEESSTSLRVGDRKIPISELGEIFPRWTNLQ